MAVAHSISSRSTDAGDTHLLPQRLTPATSARVAHTVERMVIHSFERAFLRLIWLAVAESRRVPRPCACCSRKPPPLLRLRAPLRPPPLGLCPRCRPSPPESGTHARRLRPRPRPPSSSATPLAVGAAALHPRPSRDHRPTRAANGFSRASPRQRKRPDDQTPVCSALASLRR